MPIGFPPAATRGSVTGYEAAVLLSAPNHWWKCDETSGTTLKDSIAANQYDMTLQGTNDLNYQQLIYGGACLHAPAAALYNAQNGARGAGLPADFPAPWNYDYTFECIVNPIGLQAGSSSITILFSVIPDAAAGGANNQQFSPRITGSTNQLYVSWEYGAGGTVYTTGTSTLNFNPHHIVITKDSTNHLISYYIDGLLHNSATYLAADEATGGGNCNMLIAANLAISGGALSTSLAICQIALYKKLLSADDIVTHAVEAGYFPGA